jgi:hypothetical protein
MALTPSQPPRGLSVADLVGTLGGGLLTVAVAVPGGPEVDDISIAEPALEIHGQAGDLLLGIGIDTAEGAVELLGVAAAGRVSGVVLRRATARNRAVRAAARRRGVALVELSEQASWAHVIWLLRGVLDRAAAPARGAVTDLPVHDELFALAEGCAALLDAPVTIEDTQSRVLAYSSRQDVADPIRVSTIVGRRVPEAVLASLRGRGVFRRLARSAEPFYVPAAPDGTLRPRLVIPVRAGSEWLGSIWAVVEEPPDPDVLASLAQTASVVALHLLRLRSQTDLARRLTADRLRLVLSGDLAGADEWLPPGPWRVVALDAGPTVGDPQGNLDLWESAFRRSSPRRLLIALVDDAALALVQDAPGPDGPTGPGSWPWLRELAEEVAVEHPGACAAAGGLVSRPRGLSRSRTEALEVRRILTAGRLPGPAATVELAWAPVTADRAVSAIRPGALLGPIREIQTHDIEHGTDYARTLAAWLDHPDDPRRAADRLHVHPNTLRYRMARLAEVVELDLGDPETRLALRLQLRALGH